ncbi:MAG: glycerate kinase type-2 family protein [Xanthobacteraceae bacterium]
MEKPAKPREILNELFATAVAAVHPVACLVPHLPAPPKDGRLILLAAGKAAGSMAEVAERHYRETLGFPNLRLSGLAVTRHGYGRPTNTVPVIEAGHPIPDEKGLAGARDTLALAQAAGAGDLVLVLLSGGASANWIAPAAGLTLAEKQAVTRALLRCGASIGEINTLRKHLSALKGGRLAALAAPARVVTLAISDVAGDDPAVIGSGPSVPDPSTLADARAVVAKYKLALPDAVTRALNDPANESPKPDNPVFAKTEFRLIARPADAFDAARSRVEELGYECVLLGDRIEGDATAVAAEHAKVARDMAASGRRAVILSGGELTVTIRGNGRGGPNQEYALALAIHLDGAAGIAALAADTDGTDGGAGSPDDPAGAYVDASTISRGRAAGLDPAAFLRNNDSTAFFGSLGDLITTGPTFTNVNDFRAILVDNV